MSLAPEREDAVSASGITGVWGSCRLVFFHRRWKKLTIAPYEDLLSFTKIKFDKLIESPCEGMP